jgi:hypothetical protein
MKAHVVKGYVLQLFFLLAAQFTEAVTGTADWAIVRLLAFPPCGFVLRPFGQLVLWFRHESCIRRNFRHEPVLIGCRIHPETCVAGQTCLAFSRTWTNSFRPHP